MALENTYGGIVIDLRVYAFVNNRFDLENSRNDPRRWNGVSANVRQFDRFDKLVPEDWPGGSGYLLAARPFIIWVCLVTDMSEFDFLVIGSGSGLDVANVAANQGQSVAVVEKGPTGGICLNRGCIPSKMLLYHADILETIERVMNSTSTRQ